MRGLLTWITRTLLVVTSLVVGLIATVLVGLSTDAGNDWIRTEALNAARPAFPNGSLEIGGLETNILGYVRVSEVVIRDEQGKALITVNGLFMEYGLSALLRKEVHVEAIRVEKPTLDLTVDSTGTMDLMTVFGPSDDTEEDDTPIEPFAGLPVDIKLGEFSIVDGAVRIQDPTGDVEVPKLNFGLGAAIRGSTVDITNIDVDVDVDAPLDEDIRLAGGLALVSGDVRIPELLVGFGEVEIGIDGTIASAETAPVMGLNLKVDPLSPATVEALAGESVLRVPLLVSAEVKGPLSDLNVGVSIPSPDGDGELRMNVEADLEATPTAWGVELLPSNFRVDSITELVPPPFVLDGRYAVTGTGTEYPSGIDADIQVDCGPQIFAGEAVQTLRLNGKLNAGRLGLNIQELVHDVAQVSLVSNVDLVESSARARASIFVPNAARLSKYGVKDMGGSVRYDGDVAAIWEPELDVDLEGDLQVSSFAAPGLYIASGGGPIHAFLKGEKAEATGDVTLEGLDASGTTVDSVQLVFSGEQAADGSVDVNAELKIGLVSMPDGQFDMQGLEGSMVASVPAQGDVDASADLVVKTFRFGDGDYSVDGGPVSFAMSGDKVNADIDLRRKDAPFLAGSIMGDLTTGQWNIDGFRFAVLEGDGLDAEQSMQFQLADGGAKDILIEISNADGKGALKIEGEATAEAPDLRVTADQIDLSYIVDMLGEVVDLGPTDVSEASPADPLKNLSGLASMALEIKGKDELINAEGWIDVEDLVMPGQLNRVDTRVDVSVTDSAAVATIRVADDDKTLLWSKTNVPIVQKDGSVALDCDRQLRARSMIPGVDFKKLAKQIPAIGNDLRGRASLDLKIDGEACNPSIGLVAAMDTAIGAQGERIRLDVEFDRKDDELALKTTIEQENQRIAEVGALLATRLTEVLGLLIRDGEDVDMADAQNWLDNFDVFFKVQSADLSKLARMGEVNHPIEGKLGGEVRLSGTTDNPVLRGNLALADGRVGEAKMREFTVDIAPVEDGYALETILDFFDTGGLRIDGFLPLDLKLDGDIDLARPGLDITMSGDGIPLAMAAGPTGLAEARGSIRLTGEVSGTLAQPEPKLAIRSNEAGFTLLATALRYEPIELDIEYRPDRLLIRDISVRSSQLWGQVPKSGTVSIAGDVGLNEEGPTDISISTKMKEFWLSATRQANVAASGNVSIDGGYPNLKIAGSIAMDEASISVGEEVLKDTSGFEVDETIQIHRDAREVVAVRRDEEPEESAADNFVVDLKVDLAQKVRLRADVPLSEDFGSQFSQLATFNLDLGLDGVLDIAQEKGVTSVVGELATMRGEMVALGKRFTLTEGAITFTGENYTNPQLSILAAHQVGQYGSVDIAISGDVENTAMELSSVEYPDQTDVMSMLLFGKPTSAMSETEGESGSGLLSAAMASVGGQAARATGAAFLQNVQIDPGSGSVKVGFPLTDKIYLSIEKVTPEEDTDNVTQAALEWILSRQTYGELITGDRGQSSGDLYWRWRF